MNPSNNDSVVNQPSSSVQKVPSGIATNNQPVAAPGPMPSVQLPPLTPLGINPIQMPVNLNSQAGLISPSSTNIAEDKDIIEPEWVKKAKTIVNGSSDDPFKQSEELTVLKADYMQKRYNKIVKLK